MTGIQVYYPPIMIVGETKKIIMWGSKIFRPIASKKEL